LKSGAVAVANALAVEKPVLGAAESSRAGAEIELR
jgi:hypothetical protein